VFPWRLQPSCGPRAGAGCELQLQRSPTTQSNGSFETHDMTSSPRGKSNMPTELGASLEEDELRPETGLPAAEQMSKVGAALGGVGGAGLGLQSTPEAHL
jgi:hypothetical protein